MVTVGFVSCIYGATKENGNQCLVNGCQPTRRSCDESHLQQPQRENELSHSLEHILFSRASQTDRNEIIIQTFPFLKIKSTLKHFTSALQKYLQHMHTFSAYHYNKFTVCQSTKGQTEVPSAVGCNSTTRIKRLRLLVFCLRQLSSYFSVTQEKQKKTKTG